MEYLGNPLTLPKNRAPVEIQGVPGEPMEYLGKPMEYLGKPMEYLGKPMEYPGGGGDPLKNGVQHQVVYNSYKWLVKSMPTYEICDDNRYS